MGKVIKEMIKQREILGLIAIEIIIIIAIIYLVIFRLQ